MFITIPIHPPHNHGPKQGHPNTALSVNMTLAISAIAMFSEIKVPSELEGLTKDATLIGLTLTGQTMISPLTPEEILNEINHSGLVSFRKLN